MLIISKESKNKVVKKKDEKSKKCSCGCGQEITPRDTPYWHIDGDIEEKKEVFGEGCREDDNRITNAERGLHSRLTETERAEAFKWSSYYRALVRDGVDD